MTLVRLLIQNVFFRLFDITSFKRGQRPQKLSMQETVEQALAAFERGNDTITHDGVPIQRGRTFTNGTPKFEFDSGIPVHTTVYKSATPDRGHLLAIQLGVAWDEVTEEDGVESTRVRFLELNGQVKRDRNGNASVFLFNPHDKPVYQKVIDVLQRLESKGILLEDALSEEEIDKARKLKLI